LDDSACYNAGLENFDRIKRIVAVLEKEIFPFHFIPNLTPVQYSIYNLKFLLDVLWTTIITLKKIIDSEKPDIIRLYTCGHIESGIGLYAFSNDESVYADVLVLDGWHIPVSVIWRGDRHPENQGPIEKKSLLANQIISSIKKRDLIFNLGMIYLREGFYDCMKSLFYSLKFWRNKPVLIYGSGYNWDDSIQHLFRFGITPVYRVTDDVINTDLKRSRDFSDEIKKIYISNSSLRECDQILGINVAPIILNRLSQIISNSIRESIVSYEIARKQIKDKQIRALILTVRPHPAGHAVVQAAHDSGIPVISWQHGGAGYADFLIIPYIEFINSDWHFVFGEKVAEKYAHSARMCGFEKLPYFFPVGSSSLDYIRRRKKRSGVCNSEKKIVYITTDYHRNLYTIFHPFNPLFLDEHLWIIQKRILLMAKNNPDLDFVIKLHPNHSDKEPLKSYAHDHDIHNVTIITSEKTIPELLDIAEFIIIDHITTGILQVLSMQVPTFVYTGLFPLDTDARTMLKKCAYVSDNLDDLFENAQQYILTKMISDHSISPDNQEFLKNYGTDLQSLDSSEKAAIKLNEIIGR
jgi:hypothetical protein